MIPLKYISANAWHPITTGNKRSPYPTPQSLLRQAVGITDYKFACEGVTLENIRAACVMPRAVPYQHLLAVPWAMTYTTADWVMIIVSVDDQMGWIDLARASGCRGYWRTHGKCTTWQWQPPELDEQGLKIRSRTAVAIEYTADAHTNPLKGKQRKCYDKQALIEDLKLGEQTHTQLATQYKLNRITIMKIAHEAGIRERVAAQ